MTDYYLQNRSRLQGQPKRTIADYVESQGILVPRRFDLLKEARASGRPILVRSEHEQEYDGVSGMLESFELSDKFAEASDVEEIKQWYFQKTERPLYQHYCGLLGIGDEKFKDDASFSLWEQLEGFNRTVVADTAIPQRYHVLTARNIPEKYFFNYTIVERGEIVQQFIDPLLEELRLGLPKLIALYDTIRNLSYFDHLHCPLMEFQTRNGKDYFLQYHRTRDFLPSSFIFERSVQEGELEVPFVRGATSPEGLTCRVTATHIDWECSKEFRDWKLPHEEEGSFDFHYGWVFSELMVRKRKVQIIMNNTLDQLMLELCIHHSQRSKLYKPEVSLVLLTKRFFSKEEYEVMRQKAIQTGQDQHINIQVISDGRQAYLKRV